MRESNTRFSFTHITILKLVNLLISALFFHSMHIVLLDLLLFSPLVVSLPPLVLNLQTDLIIILLLFCGTVSHLIYFTLVITPLIHLY